MENPKELAKAYERVMRVRRLEQGIINALNHPRFEHDPSTVGEYMALLNKRIQEVQGITYNKYSDARERVFWRKP